MGVRAASLRELFDMASAGPTDRSQYGPVRAILQCHHGQKRYLVGEVRGFLVMGTVWPHDRGHDYRYANYDVYVSCRECKRVFKLDMQAIRNRMARPAKGRLKIHIDSVGRVAGLSSS